MTQVEHVDFVSVLTQDLARAKRFYEDVLGLAVETEGESDMEFRLGQVTLDVFDPSSIGQPFACPTSTPRAASWRRKASSSTARRSRRVSAGRHGSRILTGTR